VQNASSLWSGEDGFGSYQASVYNKGPYAFHMLRQTFGDEKFFAFLKQFSQELAAKREIVTLDIQQAAEKALGGVDPEGNAYNVDLAWFFDQWLRGVGMPQYAFEYDVREAEGGGFIVEGVIRQRVVVGSSRDMQVLEGRQYRGIVDVTVKAKGGDFVQRVIVQGAETPFRFKVQAKPLEVVLNRSGGMLSHDVLTDKTW
jgi:aminopeptidase N